MHALGPPNKGGCANLLALFLFIFTIITGHFEILMVLVLVIGVLIYYSIKVAKNGRSGKTAGEKEKSRICFK